MSLNRSVAGFVWLFVLLFFIVGCGKSEVEKAKEFITAGMFPQSIELLRTSITKKPDDAEAHYLLGIVYINTGNFREADERFASAVRMKSDYGFQIGTEYLKAGKESLAKGQTEKAEQLFAKAIEYQRGLVVDVSKLYDGQTDPKAIEVGLKFRKQAIPGNADLIQAQENALRELAKNKSVAEMRKIVPQYGGMLSAEIQKELAPPPEWKDVPGSVLVIDDPRLYTNKGYPVKFPLIQINDKYCVIGDHFQIYVREKDASKWTWRDENQSYCSTAINRSLASYPMMIRAKKGIKVTLKLRRLM